MPARKLAEDEPFFREWRSQIPGEKRSLARARQLMDEIGLSQINVPVLTVVGSKGKATTAVYAAAMLAAHGCKVGLITSPPIINNRERFRVGGEAIDESAYAAMSRRLAALLDRLSPHDGQGYLSPTGLFTLMGVRHLLDVGCDVLVLEAGLGGRSDEVSLFSARIVAIARIFGEHLDIIGPTVADVAADKVGVVSSTTQAVFSIRQSPVVQEIIEDRARAMNAELLWVDGVGADGDVPKVATSNARGLSAGNARLGITAAIRMANSMQLAYPGDEHAGKVLATVTTPGRLSRHIDDAGRTWIVDAAIDEQGAAAALRHCVENYGAPSTILVSIPDSKDVDGVRRALAGYSYIPVGLTEEHLSFSSQPWGRALVDEESLDDYLTGDLILAIGTWSFVGLILHRLRVNPDAAFQAR